MFVYFPCVIGVEEVTDTNPAWS